MFLVLGRVRMLGEGLNFPKFETLTPQSNTSEHQKHISFIIPCSFSDNFFDISLENPVASGGLRSCSHPWHVRKSSVYIVTD